MAALEKKFQSIDWTALDEESKLENVTLIVQELWQIHCFREGNTRSTALFLYFLMKTLGIKANVDFLGKHAKYFRNALVLASCYSRSKKQYLLEIIRDCASFKNTEDGKYVSIDGYEVDRYAYSYHTIEELKTVKSLQDLERDEIK